MRTLAFGSPRDCLEREQAQRRGNNRETNKFVALCIDSGLRCGVGVHLSSFAPARRLAALSPTETR